MHMIFKTNLLAVLHNVSIQLLIDMGDELNRTRVIFRLIGFSFREQFAKFSHFDLLPAPKKNPLKTQRKNDKGLFSFELYNSMM